MHNSEHPSNRRFIRGERLAWQTVGKETVVVNLGRNQAYSLNESASLLWKRLENACTTDDLVSLLEDASKNRESVLQEVVSFLDELEDTGLIVFTERPSGGQPHESERSAAHGEPPRILWSEELRACVLQGSCAFGPGTPCEATPPGPFGP